MKNRFMFYRMAYDETPEEKATREAAEAKAAAEKNDKKFNQDDINRFLAEDRRKHKEAQEKLIKELKTLKDSGLTPEAKTAMEERIHALEQETMTKEELAQRAQDKLKNEAAEVQKQLEVDRDAWKHRYTDSTITNELISASVEHKAINPSQVVALLRSKTRLTEEVGADGKPTGKLVTEVDFEDTDKKNNPITIKMKPKDAVKRMTEMVNQYGNLFEGSKKSGAGGSGNGSGSDKITPGDQASYAALRKAQRANEK